MADDEKRPPPERPERRPLEELKDRVYEWLGAILHPPVLLPVPVPRRPR